MLWGWRFGVSALSALWVEPCMVLAGVFSDIAKDAVVMLRRHCFFI